jgi:tryptophanyl-tRNA synthetase
MKDLVLSGVQPTNNLHIGNYIGALKQWVEIQRNHRCLFCVVDLHAITVPQDPAKLREATMSAAAMYLATGIDPHRSHIFIQSEVSGHTELGWILGTITKLGELERMTQFKDKAKKRGENVGVGLFTYPVLMAADILLYDTSAVPVGEDQLQHLELARTIGRRFNTEFGETFTIPQPLIQKVGARIMALDDGTVKMSKSAPSANSYIALTDSPEVIKKKIARAVTDSGTTIEYAPETRPAVANLITIYHHATGRTIKQIEQDFAGKGYADFKRELSEALVAMLSPIQTKYQEYLSDKGELTNILNAGRDFAQEMAREKLALVKNRVGLGRS